MSPRQLLDSCLNLSRFFVLKTFWLILDSSSLAGSTTKKCVLNFDRCSTALDRLRFMSFLYKELSRFQISHPRYLLTVFKPFTFQTHFSLSKPSLHVIFDLFLLLITWYDLSTSHSSCISSIQIQVLGCLKKFWGFSKLMKVFCNFWVGYYLFEFKTSCVASHENYNNVSCILDVCLLCAMLCAGRFGLG